ncbi:MAG: sodium:calcium antiporter [Spartobacteria bacterium]|nr:sodium:calcium antiporter [Spartobacteria bacterium]
MITWLLFLLSAGILVYAGYKLTIYADRLAELLNLAKSWMGLLVVGLVTSLPELATTLSSVTKVDSPDLAIGNVFGSVLFNIVILAGCDLAFRRGGLIRLTNPGNVLSATWGIFLVAVMMIALLFPSTLPRVLPFVSTGSILVIVLGVAAFLMVYYFEQRLQIAPIEAPSHAEHLERKSLIVSFCIASVIVVICGYLLAVLGDRLAVQSGLSRTFIGTLLLAIATSLPELIVSITAIRMGAYDLMIGNVLGSNIWNVMIMGTADVFYTKGAFVVRGAEANLGWGQIFTGVLGIMATCVVIATLVYRPKPARRLTFGIESLIIIVLYALCLTGLYHGV